MALAIVTTILEPALSFVIWLDYHLQRCKLLIIYIDDPTRRPIFESLCVGRAVRLFDGAMDAPRMARSNRLRLRQNSNLKHAISFLLDQTQPAQHADKPDGWWLLHIDQDEVLFENGHTSWRTCPGVGHVTFTNHEAIPISHPTSNAFMDCVWFSVNSDKAFMAYGNGKSAVRLSRNVVPNGPHRFVGYEGVAITLPASQQEEGSRKEAEGQYPVLLHYPYPSFEAWAAKFKLYGTFSNYWLDDDRFPNMLEFML
ncbi:MAG: hypothetical protein Q9187_004000 [Circinaria calcarea]